MDWSLKSRFLPNFQGPITKKELIQRVFLVFSKKKKEPQKISTLKFHSHKNPYDLI